MSGVELAAARLQSWLDTFDRENADDIDAEDFNIGQDELIEVPAEDLRAIIAAWNRRAVPMEAVAWRVRTSCGEGGFLCDTYPRNGAALIKHGYVVQALAVIPAPGNKEEEE